VKQVTKTGSVVTVIATLFVPLLTAAILATGCCASIAVRHEGPSNDHYRDGSFYNHEVLTQRSLTKNIYRYFSSTDGHWPEWIELPPTPAPLTRVEGQDLRVTFVNHSTVLLQTSRLNLLTDPVWSERTSPVGWAGPKRVHAPGIAFDELPPIDAVLVSHNHYDHMDLPTLQRLAKKFDPLFLIPLGDGIFMEQAEIVNYRELDWWQSIEVGSATITFVPSRHFSKRGLFDENLSLWGGFVIEVEGGPLYYSGDTGWGGHFEKIRHRFGPMRLALLPISGYRPRWYKSEIHISPADAVRAHRLLQTQTSVAVHFGTFPLDHEGREEPLFDLAGAMKDAGVAQAQFIVPQPGMPINIPLLIEPESYD
jgi:L-ascorbate metabolism protein UlaG (beta-lactamase superfamily)